MTDLSWLTQKPIAHRALHDTAAGRAENSWSAFEAAIAAGYAIECDVQVSKTGEAVVFHDPILGRMTGVDGRVDRHTPAELEELRLGDTADGIYTLKKHMDHVAGRVPVVVELKGDAASDNGLVENVAEVLNTYDGPVAVMSFDQHLFAKFAPLMPQIPRGLTAEGDASVATRHLHAFQDHDLQFVSYDIHNIDSMFPQTMVAQGIPLISWTVRGPEQAQTSLRNGAQMTFEGFLPPLDAAP